MFRDPTGATKKVVNKQEPMKLRYNDTHGAFLFDGTIKLTEDDELFTILNKANTIRFIGLNSTDSQKNISKQDK